MCKRYAGGAAIGALLCCVGVSGAPRDERTFTLPKELQGRARIVNVQDATPIKLLDGRTRILAEAEEPLAHPANVVIEVINDEAVARGITAADGSSEAPVFFQMEDSGYGFFINNTPGALEAHQMILGNGWRPGDTLSSFVARVYVPLYKWGAYEPIGSFYLELWDGDPLGVFDTTCSAGGVPAPIPGTGCTFNVSDMRWSVVYDLKCVFPEKIQWNCDRVFGVVFPREDACRWAWRLSMGWFGHPPQVGYGNGIEVVFGCESFGLCDTPSGFNVGVCCDDQAGPPLTVPCDHSNANPGLWTPPGGCDPTGITPHATYCMDDDGADYFWTYYNEAPEYYHNFVGAAYAASDKIVKVLPVAVDGPVGSTPPEYAVIDGNTVTIDADGACQQHYIMFELYVPDWDPAATGLKLKAYQVSLDATRYSAGLRGTLTPFRPPCATDADCEPLFGPLGTGAGKGGCPINFVQHCAGGWIDDTRPDFIFSGQAFLGGVDQSTPDYRYGATLFSPIPSPHIGDMYAGTLALTTMAEYNAGDFEVRLGLPTTRTHMVDENNQFIPLLGIQGASVDFPLGQCCDMSADPPVCISDTVTRCECYERGQAGGYTSLFDLTKDCADDCAECLDETQCGDGDACTVDTCVDNFCVHTAVSVGANECCDYTCMTGDTADLYGFGVIAGNADGNACTHDLCSDPGACAVGDACGVPVNPPVDAGTPCYDGEPCLTVNDACDAAGKCAGTDIQTIACTSDDTCENLTMGLGDCCIATGRCRCPPPVCGDNVVNQPGEDCDGTDDSACPGECRPNCACPSDTPVPAVSAWGLIVMALLLLACARVYFGRRRPRAT